MRISRRIRTLLLIVPVLISFSAKADWLNLTGAETAANIAEIYILEDHVKIQLEVYPKDLEVFKSLIPEDWIKEINPERPSLDQRQAHFANHTLVISTAEGEVLPAEFSLVEARTRVDRRSPFAGMRNPYTGQQVPDAPADKRVIYAEIIYPFEGRPQALKITPPLDESGNVRVTIGFIAYHQSVPIVDFRYLGQSEKLTLNWEDPWYTEFENRNLTRHHKYPMMVYLYVEPRRVRLESLMRVSDIANMTGFNDTKMSDNALMHEKLRSHVLAFFSARGSLDIDSETALPDQINIGYFTAGVTGLTPVENPSRVDDASLLMGISQQYYIDTLPQRVRSEWPYFNPRIDKIPIVETDPAGPLPGFIFQEEPEFEWKNLLKTYQEPAMQPLETTSGWRISIPFYGDTTLFSELPDEARAIEIISGLLENLRIAHIEQNPVKLNDALSKVTAPDAPDVLALELSKLFATDMKRGGTGAVEQFENLRIENILELEDPDGLRATVSGQVMIEGMHWGHTDRMQLAFQLLLDLIAIENQWRLSDLTIINLAEAQR